MDFGAVVGGVSLLLSIPPDAISSVVESAAPSSWRANTHAYTARTLLHHDTTTGYLFPNTPPAVASYPSIAGEINEPLQFPSLINQPRFSALYRHLR